MASGPNRSAGLDLRGRGLLLEDQLSEGVPVQAPEADVHHENLPPEHQLGQWEHLLGYFEEAVEPGVDDLESAPLAELAADGSEP